MSYEPMMTQREVAVIFRVTPRTVKRWWKAGRLKIERYGYRTIRIPVSEVNRLIEESKK